jgi:hypothetical protein
MRRCDFTIGLLLAAATQSVRAQEPSKQHRIAIVIPAGPVAVISETGSDSLLRRLYQPFFEELRRLGDVEAQNLIVERYSGEGQHYALATQGSSPRWPYAVARHLARWRNSADIAGRTAGPAPD